MDKSVLEYDEYAEDIDLFKEYIPERIVQSDEERERIIDFLLNQLDLGDFSIPPIENLDMSHKRQVLRGVLNTLKPGGLRPESVCQLNRLLQSELRNKIIHSPAEFEKKASLEVKGTKIGMFQGDITTLGFDAIVNAANSQMLGCFQPLHNCIDNVIHSAAGVQLRDDCHTIMSIQGHPEPTGKAKITRAYNLPSRFVLHTVGPIVKHSPGNREEQLLKSCYTECLDLCASIPQIRSIAFCCISTGVFGYPQDAAAHVAFDTVREWVNDNPDTLDMVLFNVFTDKDRVLYSTLMEK